MEIAGQIFKSSQVLGKIMSETEGTVRYLWYKIIYLQIMTKISFPEYEKLNAMRRLFFQSLLNLLADHSVSFFFSQSCVSSDSVTIDQ